MCLFVVSVASIITAREWSGLHTVQHLAIINTPVGSTALEWDFFSYCVVEFYEVHATLIIMSFLVVGIQHPYK